MIERIKQQKLRYIVPFQFEPKDFDMQCDRLIETSQWQYESEDNERNVKNHIFCSIFKRSDEKESESEQHPNIGCCFLKTGEAKLPQVNYTFSVQDCETEKNVSIKIINYGLFLFRTGVGFFWYEISNPGIEDSELIDFQFKFKRLGHKPGKDEQKQEQGNEIIKWIEGILSFKKSDLPEYATLFNYVLAEAVSNEDVYSLGYHLTTGYNKTYMPPQDVEEKMFRPFGNVYWYTTIEGCGCYVKWNEASNKFFSEYFLKNLEQEYFKYYILALYQSYTLQGFSQMLASKLPADSADYKIINNAFNEELIKWLDNFETKLNLFLVRGVYGAVSGTQHHNTFFDYIVKQLHIKEDIESLNLGLKSLDELQRMKNKAKKDEQAKSMSIAMTTLSLLAITSSFMNGAEFVEKLVYKVQAIFVDSATWAPIEWIIFCGQIVMCGIIACVGAVAMYHVFKNFFSHFGKRWKRES